MSQLFGPRDEDEGDDDYFVDIGGGLHDNEHDTIEANLGYEEAWGTGVGCGQDEDNVDSDDD